MVHPPLNAILSEIERDLYYFTKIQSHRTMVMDHFRKLQEAIDVALKAEYDAGRTDATPIANRVKERLCKS